MILVATWVTPWLMRRVDVAKNLDQLRIGWLADSDTPKRPVAADRVVVP
ncbi:hypothetical protein [Nocardia sp. CA-135398]